MKNAEIVSKHQFNIYCYLNEISFYKKKILLFHSFAKLYKITILTTKTLNYIPSFYLTMKTKRNTINLNVRQIKLRIN